MFESYINESMLGRAQTAKKVSISLYNPRDYTTNKHNQVDDKPYGGGPGMVLQAEPVIKAIEKAKGRKKNVRIVWFSPGGNEWSNTQAKQYCTQNKHIILVCGRYEGVDARVKEVFDVEEVSVGPYVLTGGELPAMIVMDTIARQIPGILGKNESLEENRTASHDVYTRPEQFKYKNKTYTVPDVLLSGDHKKIEEWRKNK